MRTVRFPRLTAAVALAVLALLAPIGITPAAAISSLGSIPVGDAPNRIVLRGDGAVAFVSNNLGASVSAITLSTQAVTPISVGFNPSDLMMRPGTNELWVANYASGSISIVNALTFTETTFFMTAGSPQNIAFSANGSRAYVTFPLTDEVKVYNASTRALVDTYAVGDSPAGVAVDAARNRLIVASGGSTATGERVNFVSLANGAVTSLALIGDANDVFVDAARNRAYVTMFGLGLVAVINLSTNALITYWNIGGQPLGMSPSFDNRLLFIARGSAIVMMDLETVQQRASYTTPNFTNDVVMALDGRTVYSTAFNSDAVSVARLELDRFAGSDRYKTAIAMSKEAYPGTSGTVYIANGTSFPDALSITPAISYKPGPLLLVESNRVRADVLAEVNRLNPQTIVIAGGTGVVSSAAAAQLAATGADIVRLSGSDRYATSRAVVSAIFTDAAGYDDLYLVTGRNFPDALSAGPAAGANDAPMLLVDGSANRLPSATLSLIKALKPKRVILVGGTGVMSTGIRNQVDAIPGVDVVRAAGADRYATSQAVNELGFDFRTSPASFWATGANFPDALAGITLAAPVDAPIYLVQPTCLPSAALHGAWRHNADRIGILGGTGVVSSAVAKFTRC